MEGTFSKRWRENDRKGWKGKDKIKPPKKGWRERWKKKLAKRMGVRVEEGPPLSNGRGGAVELRP